MNALRRLLQVGSRNELIALSLMLLGTLALPGSVPGGIYGIGVVNGSGLALHAIALILVFRSSRVINFAQASFGLSSAMLFSSLVHNRTLLRVVEPLCTADCLNNPAAIQINYWVALVASLGLAVLLGWLTYFVVVRRFANAPRIVLTVATIFVGYIAVGLTSQLVQALVPNELREQGGPPPGSQAAAPPFDFVAHVGQVSFHAVDFLTIAVALSAATGLFLYLRGTSTGNMIRAAADNPDRAMTLGANVGAITGRVWIIAAVLAGIAGILGAMAQGTAGAAIGPGTEVRILAAAILGRMVSLPLAACAALALGIMEQSIQWTFGSTLLLDGTLFILIGALLLAQVRNMGAARKFSEEWQAAEEVRPIPRELRSLPVVRKWVRTGFALLALLVIGLPWVAPQATTNLASAVMVYMMIGLSLLVLTGWAGQISLGQVAFAALGAYVAAVAHLPFIVALLVGGACGSLVALVIGIPALRLRGLHLAVITLAFHQAVVAVVLNPSFLGKYLPENLSRPSPLGIDFEDERTFYYLILAAALGVAFAVLGMRKSRTARALIAARDNEEAAQAFGINLTRARVGAFAASGFISAFAGVLLAYHQKGVQGAAFNVPLSRTIFLYTVIGGLGTIAGPVVGFFYYAAPLIFRMPLFVGLLLSGPLGLVLLLYTPGGLAQLLVGARDGWLRKIARRNRVIVPSLLEDLRVEGIHDRAALAPKARPRGVEIFVPSRYELESQWAIEPIAGASRPRNGGEGGK